MNTRLQFGIPSFDALFDREPPAPDEGPAHNYGAYGVRLSPEQPTTSMCFIGPDGTGKSVFGLHLAAQYMAEANLTEAWVPRVLYVSTDLKHKVANVMWENFGLHLPNQREFPFSWGYRAACQNLERFVELAWLDPADIQSAFLDQSPNQIKVQFVDLVSKTMGDDWGFIDRLLAVLTTPQKGESPHLLIIDAVEGFETLVGEKDAFGERTSRRARIAQIMRTAGEKCHVCFIVEEPRSEERFPEEFVTDVVVRLRSLDIKGYSRRTIEVRKARGQSHVRGQHPFVIRDKLGSTTGFQVNADDPTTKNSYVHIFPSLHYLSREEMKNQGGPNPDSRTDRVAAFGISYLDEMLARPPSEPGAGLDDQGLPVQTTTALIGELATQKTTLATAFLARTFRAFIFQLADIIREICGLRNRGLIHQALKNRICSVSIIRGTDVPRDLDKNVKRLVKLARARDSVELQKRLDKLLISAGTKSAGQIDLNDPEGVMRFATWLAEALEDSGAAVLITTSNQDRDKIVSQLQTWLESSRDKALQDWPTFTARLTQERANSERFRKAVKDHLISRTICRRLELHDLSYPLLYYFKSFRGPFNRPSKQSS